MKRLMVVDDDVRVLQGLQRQLDCMRHEWEMHFLDSGAKAHEFMATVPLAAVVIDMRMPAPIVGVVTLQHRSEKAVSHDFSPAIVLYAANVLALDHVISQPEQPGNQTDNDSPTKPVFGRY